MAASRRLAATPSTTPTTEPVPSRISRRPSATEGAGDGQQESKSTKEAEGDGRHLGRKEVQPKLAVPNAGFPDRNAGVEVADHFANSVCHIGHVAAGLDDERCQSICVPRDWEEGRRSRIFGERQVFSVGYDADDLYRQAEGGLEIAAHGVVGVEEAAGELAIHDGNGWRIRSVG